MRVLVTGAASGIGRATCVRLARDGQANETEAKVAAVDFGRDADLESLESELSGYGAEAIALDGDMGAVDAPAAVVDEAVARFGGLDALVSNAGINRVAPLAEYDVDDWDRLFAVNVRATWLLAKAAHPALKAAGGSVVAVASMSGSHTHAGLGAYASTKAAVIMLARVLAQEFGRDGIRVNTISPGMTRTGMTTQIYANNEVAAARDALVPIGRVAVPEDIADAIAFLLGNDARYINGHDLVVDGGVSGNHLGRLPGLQNITRG